MTQTAIGAAPEGIALTLEDLALLADGTGNIPDDSAVRLQTLIRCGDPARFEAAGRWIAAQLKVLRRMAADAGVDLLADGLYVSRCLERLRSGSWCSPTDVLDPRLDVPYQELIAMAGACADRARDEEEQAELRNLIERLVAGSGRPTGR